MNILIRNIKKYFYKIKNKKVNMRRKKKDIVNIYLHLYGLNCLFFIFLEIYGLNYFFFFSNFQLSIIKKRERKVEKNK